MTKKIFLLSSVFATLMMAGCKKDDPNDGQSRIMAVHASPDAPAVDILVDNQKQNNAPLAYPGNSGYVTVSAGNRNLKINLAGTTTTVIEGSIPLQKDRNYSVFAIGRVNSISAIAAEDNLAAPPSGKAHIRFFHLSPGTQNLTVGTLSGSNFTALYTNRAFETQTTMNAFSGFTPIDAGTYTLDFRVAGTTGSLFSLANTQLQAGKIYTIYARGILGSTTTPLGAALITHN